MPWGHRGVLVLILLFGFAVRLPHVADPPLGFHATRQYRSAIIARGYYLPQLRGLTPEESTAARAAAAAQGAIEPPVIEHLAAWAYLAAGREALWIPRLLSVVAWTGGGAAMWWLAELLLSPAAAVASVALFMFLPFGIVASQAFQPDPLMTGLTVFALAAGLHHHKRPCRTSLVLYACAAAAAVLVKPMALFLLVPAAVVLAVQRDGVIRGFRFAFISMTAIGLPAVVYYYFGTEGVLEKRFFMQLLREPSFWRGWAAMLEGVAGWPAMLAGLAGIALSSGSVRQYLLALWCGYALLGVAFSYHIHTHDYYSLPLVPVISVSVAAMIDAVRRTARSAGIRRGLDVAGLVALIAGASLWSQAAGVFQSAADLRAEVARYQRIGEIMHHSSRVASLDFGSYGYALNYHAFLNASNWPLSIDLALDRLNGQPGVPMAQRLAGLNDVDFFVATSQDELEKQPELGAFLDARLLVARDGSPDNWRFVVYDLKRTGVAIEPQRVSLPPGSSRSVALRTLPDTRWQVEVPAPRLFDVLPSEGSGPGTLTIVSRGLPVSPDQSVEVQIYAGESRSALGRLTVRIRSVPESPGDYDADGKADLTVFRPTEATWYSQLSGDHFTNGKTTFGASVDVPVPGDYDGDGKSDLAVFRPTTSTWLVLESSTGKTLSYALGAATDAPVPADYDGDHRTDPATYRPSDGLWTILESTKNYTTPTRSTFGASTDIPVPGDYDGDGKANIAVFRPSTGMWRIMDAAASLPMAVHQWGVNGDIPVPGDYDGDGKTDLAIFRPSTSRWEVRKPSYNLPWGLDRDIPVPADYDGDGKTDLAVWRPSTGGWWILKSSTGYTESMNVPWGLPGDIPILRRP